MGSEVRSAMGACTGVACRCVHFLPILQGPPSSHPPGRCLAYPHLPEMLIKLLQPQSTWSAHWPLTLTRLPRRESAKQNQHQENEPHVHTIAANTHRLCRQQISFESQQRLVGHKVRPARAKDSRKRSGTKRIMPPSQIPGQSPSLTSIEQDWKH